MVAASQYAPTITQREFDSIAPDLCAELKRKYETAKSDAERPPPNPATKGAFDHVPDLDSKTVASWSPTIAKHLGGKLDPEFIRKGGYDSFDDFWGDISVKLRNACRKASSEGRVAARVGDSSP